MACFRELTVLRYTSFLGFLASITIMLVLVVQLFSNDSLPAIGEQVRNANWIKIDGFSSIVDVVPVVIFSYMY